MLEQSSKISNHFKISTMLQASIKNQSSRIIGEDGEGV